MNLQAMLQQFQNNPVQFLMQRNLNIPQEMLNNPQAAIQHLMNSGQMSQAQFNRFQQMARSMGLIK